MACHALRMILTGIQGLGIDYITVYRAHDGVRDASVVFFTDEDARQVADAFGATLHQVSDGRSMWSTVDVTLESLRITIAGPMRARLEVVPNSPTEAA